MKHADFSKTLSLKTRYRLAIAGILCALTALYGFALSVLAVAFRVVKFEQWSQAALIAISLAFLPALASLLIKLVVKSRNINAKIKRGWTE